MTEREIKFRWKRKDNGEWVYGCLIINPINKAYRIYVQPQIDTEGFKVHIITPETVGQFFGRKDKGENEIYEGDIVLIEKGYYNDGRDKIGIMAHLFTGAGSTIAFTINGGTSPWDYETCEVIGNIYENPELLEENNK